MCITICIIQFIIILLLILPYARRLMKSNKIKTTSDKCRISAMIAPMLYTQVIRAATAHKCTISAYITGAVKDRLERESISEMA